MSKPTVRKEERAIYTRVQKTGRYYRCKHRYHRPPRTKREKAKKDARKKAYRYYRPAPVLPVEGRYHRQCKISQNMSSAGFLPAGTTGVSPVLPAVAGTTGQSPVLPVVQFLAKLRSRAGTAGTTGPEGRYYRLTLAEKKLSRSSCVQVCLSSARPKLT
jgi:hypothetical protein